jgi:hypothetical protein
VALCALVLYVRGVNGNTAGFFFRSVVNAVIRSCFCATGFGQNGGNSCGQSGFTVVNVANSAYVDVGLGPVKFICHSNISFFPSPPKGVGKLPETPLPLMRIDKASAPRVSLFSIPFTG